MSEDPQTTQEDVTKGELGGEAATSPSPTASTVATSTSGPSGEYTSKKRTRRMAGNSQEKDDDDVTRDGVIREEVLSALEADLLSCDVHVSLFVCAAASYRHDSVLRPFPNAFETTSGEKDIEKLRSTLQCLPDLETVKERLKRGCYVPTSLVRLLHWILIDNPSGLVMSTVPKSDHASILSLSGSDTGLEKASSSTPTSPPTHVFRVHNGRSAQWEDLRLSSAKKKTLFCFHGSRTDNFHSILSHGLQQHLNKTSLFGEGIYFSSELVLALSFSGQTMTWERSLLGDRLTCVLLCEVIDHPDVKMNSEDSDRNHIRGSEGGKVPEKYLIVRNNDLVRNRYLLVYAAKERETVTSSLTGWESWLREHKFTLVLALYGLLLLTVGLCNSPQLRRLLRRNGFVRD